MRIIVTGGAGFIGSHTCVQLMKSGEEVVIIDNLATGSKQSLESIGKLTGSEPTWYNVDICDTKLLQDIYLDFRPEATVHFAGLKSVSNSCVEPEDYYRVNIGGTASLLSAMSISNCCGLIFSSSASVYGNSNKMPLTEDSKTMPASPYARTKLYSENMINDWAQKKNDNKAFCLRYFNPIGAHQSGFLGENITRKPESLMQNIYDTLIGKQRCLEIFSGYDTPDGTGIRDFIHVEDLANAHLAALNYLGKISGMELLNIGRGQGLSVGQVVDAFEKICPSNFCKKFVGMREGDIHSSWANPEKANKMINWVAEKNLEQMCEDSLRWLKYSSQVKG